MWSGLSFTPAPSPPVSIYLAKWISLRVSILKAHLMNLCEEFAKCPHTLTVPSPYFIALSCDHLQPQLKAQDQVLFSVGIKASHFPLRAEDHPCRTALIIPSSFSCRLECAGELDGVRGWFSLLDATPFQPCQIVFLSMAVFLLLSSTSLYQVPTLKPALKTHQLSQKRQAPDWEGSSWESYNRRGPHPDPPQEEPTEEILKAKLSCPSLSHAHGPENQPRRIRRGLDHRGKRTTRRARLDTIREEGVASKLLNVLIG